MRDQSATPYRTNHASFELPPQLADKTMHVFTPGDSGANEFSVVISHAAAGPDESLAEFGARLLRDMRGNLADFTFEQSLDRTVDGAPALELFYNWRSDGHLLRQRQLITLLPGAAPGTQQAMMIGATFMHAFAPRWTEVFDGILDSIKLRQPAAVAIARPVAAAVPLATTVFALSERRNALHVFVDREEVCRRTDPYEVEGDAWTFFDAAGSPMRAHFIVPNSGTMWRKNGTFILEAWPGGTPLHARLHQVVTIVPDRRVPPMNSNADVQTYLDRELKG